MGMKYYLLLGLALSMIACSTTPPPEPVIPPQEPKIFDQKGFSLFIPDGSGWVVAKESPYKVILAKPGAEQYERYTLQALVVRLPEFETDDDFIDFITTSMDKNSDETRFRKIDQMEDFIEGKNGLCVQINSKSEDLEAMKKTDSTQPMILEVISFTCRHPLKKGVGVYIAYANRYYHGNVDQNLAEDAISILEGLEFTGL